MERPTETSDCTTSVGKYNCRGLHIGLLNERDTQSRSLHFLAAEILILMVWLISAHPSKTEGLKRSGRFHSKRLKTTHKNAVFCRLETVGTVCSRKGLNASSPSAEIINGIYLLSADCHCILLGLTALLCRP